jgi:hypothetical protein
MKAITGLGAAALLLASSLASATTYDFSYDDPGNFLLTGSFQGTLGSDGNTVTVVGPMHVTLTELFGGPLAVKGVDLSGPSGNAVFTSTGPAVATLDGSFMQFADCTNACGDGFELSTVGGYAFETYGRTEPGFSVPYIRSDWSVQGVPEPATLLLLGIGMAGLGFMRRRKNT